MKKTIHFTYQQLPALVSSYQKELKNYDIITVTGGLGAGKTTFIRQLMTLWGVDPMTVTSPTFTYLNTYHAHDGLIIYHFDLYRIGSLSEFKMLGFDEYLYQAGSKAILEWPEPIISLLTHSVIHLTLEYGNQQDERTLIL